MYKITFHFENQAKKIYEILKFLLLRRFPFKNQGKQKFWKLENLALNINMDPISI